MELKVSCRFIENLQLNNSNVKLLHCYGTFLTSINLTCTEVKTNSNPAMTQQIRPFHETLHTPCVRWGRNPGITSHYAKNIPTQIKYPSLFWMAFLLKPHHAGTKSLICFPNQFSGSYMTQVPTGILLQTYFSMEIIKTPQRHPNIQKLLYFLTIPKAKLNLALKMIRTPKSFCKLRLMYPYNFLQYIRMFVLFL